MLLITPVAPITWYVLFTWVYGTPLFTLVFSQGASSEAWAVFFQFLGVGLTLHLVWLAILFAFYGFFKFISAFLAKSPFKKETGQK